MVSIPNDDILECIIRTCTTTSLATLSAVSSRIRMFALPHLLRTVSLDQSPEQIVVFLNFILNNTQSESRNVNDPADIQVDDHDSEVGIVGAGRHVVKFEICVLAFNTIVPLDNGNFAPAEEEEYPISLWAPILTRALVLMPNLQSAVIEDCVEELALHSPDFPLTLLSRPRLTFIDLGGLGLLASDRFGQSMEMRKDFLKFKSVGLHAHSEMDELPLISGKGIGSVLSYSRAHLTDITLEMCNLGSLLRGDSSTADQDHFGAAVNFFPNVATLTLNDCGITLEAIASSFPAMRTLNLGFSPFLRGRSKTSHASSLPSFPSLTSIQGRYKDVVAFFESSIDHERLRRVVVDRPWVIEGGSSSISNFTPFRILPRLRSLSFIHLGIMLPDWWKELSNAMPHLTYLAISVVGRYKNGYDLDHFCAQVPRMLTPAAVDYVSLILRGDELVIHADADPEFRSLYTDEAIVLSYARSIVTLKYMDIKRDLDTGAASTTWWRVIRSNIEDPVWGLGAVVKAKSLDEGLGQALKRWYDLDA